jgi:molybdate transport system permease protein
MDWTAIALSVKLAALVCAILLVIALPLAWWLTFSRWRGAFLVESVVALPLVLPPTVLGYYLLVLLGRHSVLGRAFEAVTGSPLTFTKAGAVVAAMVHALPAIAKSSRAALQDVDPLLRRAAASLGAGELRTLWAVSLPVCGRQILTATMLAFARSLGDFGVTLMVAGNIPGVTQTAALAIYDAVEAGRQDTARSLVAVLSIVSLAVLYGVNLLSARRPAGRRGEAE